MASRITRPGRASAKKAVEGVRTFRNGTSPKRTGSPCGGFDEVLGLEVRSLRNPVLFQKAKLKLLRSGATGPEQANTILADYLKIVLTLTGASAGSVLLHENDRLVFRAAAGPGLARSWADSSTRTRVLRLVDPTVVEAFTRTCEAGNITIVSA